MQELVSYDNVVWLDNTSLIAPTLRMSSPGDMAKVAKANYMYVPDFLRYYFITEIVAGNGNILYVTGKVDVLMSYKQTIKNLTTYIERQEKIWSPFMIDEQTPTRTERIITVKKIGNIGNPSGSYIALTTTGGENK